ncbi:13681_t:CDS:2 [Entrophospora sp. SA101]|nr:13681_t:CDS:2 [Entrophospora sp. SA101]
MLDKQPKNYKSNSVQLTVKEMESQLQILVDKGEIDVEDVPKSTTVVNDIQLV